MYSSRSEVLLSTKCFFFIYFCVRKDRRIKLTQQFDAKLLQPVTKETVEEDVRSHSV